MTENWVMLGTGVLLIVFGFGMTDVRGAMPGARPGYPPSLRFRLIVVGFGLLMFILALIRLMKSDIALGAFRFDVPSTLRSRVILISFGVFMLDWL
jgi:hypothetical protein